MSGVFNHINISETNSTNDFAIALIKEGQVSQNSIVSVVRQYAGRGQEDNLWESEAGKNLTISIIIQPWLLLPDKQFVLNQIASMAVHELIKGKVPGFCVRVKWPNDVYVDNKKVAGILINNLLMGNRIQWSVIGIGVNINQVHFTSNAPNPVSLKMITGLDYDLEKCLNELTTCFSVWYEQLKIGNHRFIHEAYLKHLYKLNERALFLYRGEKISGTLTGLGEFGRLRIEKSNGNILECDLRELVFIDEKT